MYGLTAVYALVVECEARGVPPGSVCSKLARSREGAEFCRPMTGREPLEDVVLAWLQTRPVGWTVVELTRGTGASTDRVRRALDKLARRGRAHCRDSDLPRVGRGGGHPRIWAAGKGPK